MSPVEIARILLVEDSKEDVLFFKRAIDKAGLKCELEVVHDGQEAVDRLSESASSGVDSSMPSHILLDLKLPGLSGLEILAWLRSHPRYNRIPVMILTSSRLPSDVNRAKSLGIDEYFVKPISFHELLEIVRTIAARWKIRRAAPP